MEETPIGILHDVPLTRNAKIDRLDGAILALTNVSRPTKEQRLSMAQLLFSIRQGLKQESE